MNINNAGAVSSVAEAVTQEALTSVSVPEKTAAVEKRQALESREAEGNKRLSSVQNVEQLAKEMNEMMDELHTSLGFSISEKFQHQVIVEIKDRETNELIKQIPSEELLDIKEKMLEFTGLLFDQNV